MELMTENPKNGLKAITSFFAQNHISRLERKRYDYVFEHGQLWIVNATTGAQWSAVDAEGGSSVNGFDFEQVAFGDDE